MRSAVQPTCMRFVYPARWNSGCCTFGFGGGFPSPILLRAMMCRALLVMACSRYTVLVGAPSLTVFLSFIAWFQRYTQTLGAHTWTLRAAGTEFSAARDDTLLFTATRGVRVLTSLATGKVVGVVGISTSTVDMTLTVASKVTQGKVEPNCEYSLDGNGGLTLTRRVPFKDQA